MKKVLVIDDDMVGRRMITRFFESLGFTGIQSSNGKHGWETLWENQDICLVCSDIIMPDMDGRELTTLIRHNAAFQKLPILLVSGLLPEEDNLDLLELGNIEFLAKPIRLTTLTESVNRLLSDNDEQGDAQDHEASSQ